MKPSYPRRFDVRWTCKLIRRDVKNLFSRSKAAKHPQLRLPKMHQEPSLQETRAQPEVPHVTVASTAPDASSSMVWGVDSKGPASFYELLEASLKDLYKTRDRDLPDDERWRLRGSYLLLSIAVQACPSNPVYDLWHKRPDDLALLTSLFEQCMAVTRTHYPHVSPLPAEPYTKRSSDHIRYDSMFSTSSSIPSVPTPPSAEQLYYTILQGCNDITKTVEAATAVLEAACPELIAADVIQKMGDPKEHFSQEDILVSKIRNKLFPEYDDLVKNPEKHKLLRN